MAKPERSQKRLLYVVSPAKFFVTHRLPLALAARSHGFEVAVCTPDGPGVDAIQQHGLTWMDLKMDRGGMNPLRDMMTLLYLLRLYRRWRPDVVHHVTIKPVLYGTVAARMARVNRVVNAISGMGYLFTGGGWKAGLATALYRLCLRHRDMAVIVQNPDDKHFFLQRQLVQPDRLQLITGSGVDLERFTPKQRSDEDTARPMVVQTCRMLADKGVREFIAAARQLRSSHPEARFVLVGAPDPGNPTTIPIEELETAVRQGDVEWWGERSDIPEILARATVYVLASYREGLSKALIEAAAAGLPLVTTDTTGCRDVVRDGENGLLVPPRDAGALAVAIARLLDDPELRERLGKAARADAEARYGIDGIIAAQLALY
ncbi:MAG: glycosyltransferase family 1 protein [Sphingomonadales bacterium]|nr:MAG: glycosyltransferase family 1 protein [Sphingomonadales bacterium]